MTTIYSADDPVSARWAGVGRPLTAYEANYNFYQHETRLAVLEANYRLTISIASISQPTSSTMRVTLTDATFTDVTMPIASFRDRGDWAVATPYLVNDTFNASDGGLYRVLFDHTSDAISFDPNANDGAGHDYYASMIPPRGNTIAAGGAVGMYYRKNSATDYVANWSYIQASEVRFSASTGSALTSTLVSDALEELETLISSSIAAHVVAAIDVTFTPSTGSALVSTNVAAALEELDVAVIAKLPLAGGTMTGALVLAADPSSGLQAATKQYVDGLALNLGKRGRVRAATTATITIATALNNGDAIDGVTLATDDLVLVKNQSAPAENGVYVVGASPVRSSEFDTYDEHPGTLLAVEEGSTNSDTIWLCTSNAGGTLNTTAIVFSQSSATGALLASNNLSDLTNAGTARTNLGLGTAATHAATDFQTADAQLFSNIPQNSKSAAYTTVLTDGQKHIFHPAADTTARTFTIDSNANVAYPIGTAIMFVNQHSAGVVTIAITADTMRLAGAGSTGSRTLAADGVATALKITATEWIISGTGLT